ncbi:MAG: hypothetical protein B5M56_09775 [Desulfococcus sp. 4484_241]|nr:MAG: hypothetical protein B5M56_09775 [Desulfococcus sp. 4484_241]
MIFMFHRFSYYRCRFKADLLFTNRSVPMIANAPFFAWQKKYQKSMPGQFDIRLERCKGPSLFVTVHSRQQEEGCAL